MKTGLMSEGAATAPIVALLDAGTAHSNAEVVRARAFAEPLLSAELLDTGENALAHADGVAAILHGVGAAQELQAAAYLVYAGDFLNKPEEVVARAFGDSHASLVMHTRRLVQLQRAARDAKVQTDRRADVRAEQTERVRKMLLAFSRDLRVVLLRLASRLQTLRWYAASKQPCPRELADESQAVFAPLANRLGIWQIKWELEDLAFRFREPEAYKALAKALHETRVERERRVEAARAALQADLHGMGLAAEVQGRPKHLYSIHKKMQGKDLALDRVFDLRALRVIVASVADCYAALARLHEIYTPVPGEFDDYIAKPKANGYQSLHTVVLGADGRAMEVQIRTREMHEHAEHGVAAHWAYKEAGARGYAGVSAAGEFEEQVARARKAVLNQLLAWERDTAQTEGGPGFDDRIYVFTPQATIVELAAGATPVDFAYAVHTDLGHRCRGARIDGQMLPLNTPLHSGQTVEIIAAKEGGPSLDWLNPELGYLQSQRSRAKVRAWFNALQQAATVAKGRELVEKLLQREGRTALKLDELASRLGFKGADALFEVVGKDEYSLRNIELLLRPPEPAADADELLAQRHTRSATSSGGGRGGVLVVGIDSLLTTLSRCCRPAPPDAIQGFVTRGKGVAIHRSDCSNLAEMKRRSPERVIAVEWGGGEPGAATGKGAPVYPVDVLVEAGDRQGLLRDVLEVFAKEKMNVVAVNTQSMQAGAAKPKAGGGDTAWMSFTLELSDASKLAKVLRELCAISGVRSARRK
jgi:GTP pyrophosphokinase